MTASTSPSPASGNPSSMSPAELLFGDFAGEFASTRRMLERYPDGKGQWRPDEKSRPLGPLATHVAGIITRGTMVLEHDDVDVATRQPPPVFDSARELLTYFDENVSRLNASLEQVDYATLAQTFSMRRGSQTLIERPKGYLLRVLMMSHLVHHRAQVGVYYRLLGIPVPGMYGPSADD
jgi:uncharacterized damage-inducible protein DinB